VAGESYHRKEFTELFRRHGANTRQEGGAEMRLPATLVPDPGNPYGHGHAVAVFVDGLHVGYLAADESSDYFRVIQERTDAGAAVTVESRQWASGHGADLWASVNLFMPQPEGFRAPIGLPDSSYVVLPVGSAIQVTKEEEHLDVLGRYVGEAERPIAVTLHMISEARPRSVVEAVEVRLNGERVGVLTPTNTANLKPLVEYANARGLMPVAKATLHGNRIKADVTLYVAKAHDVDQAWLDSLGPEIVQSTAAESPNRHAVE
jgi:hypothetical protein